MKLKLICCEVFIREVSSAIAKSTNIVKPDFTPKGAHEKSDYLRELIQKKIDAPEDGEAYDAIILGFGLCGNSMSGIKAGKLPLIIPRAHDCCTIFLGSKERFLENFSENLSATWSTSGYMEWGDSYLRETDTGKLLGNDKAYADFVEIYGEENAAYLWEVLNPKIEEKEIIFIDTPETSHLGYISKIQKRAADENKELKIIKGDSRLINALINGDWNEKEFLTVAPGSVINAVYDHDIIMTSEPK
jgi:hypothetical protein